MSDDLKPLQSGAALAACAAFSTVAVLVTSPVAATTLLALGSIAGFCALVTAGDGTYSKTTWAGAGGVLTAGSGTAMYNAFLLPHWSPVDFPAMVISGFILMVSGSGLASGIARFFSGGPRNGPS